jgi:hypothetical protein
MNRVPDTHPTTIAFAQSPPAHSLAGTEMVLRIQVSCPHGCNLQGKKIRVLGQDGSELAETELGEFIGNGNTTGDFKLRTPVELGEIAWRAFFPFCEEGNIRHDESHLRFSFQVLPHETSIAVWDTPSPAILGREGSLKVGVKCSAACNLAGENIEIQDHEGNVVATGILAESPWPGSQGLYWIEISFQTPRQEGYYSWKAQFREPRQVIPHQGAILPFGFQTARSPECRLSIEVRDSETKAPIADAFVAANTYHNYTDAHGRAILEITGGTYEIYVWRDGYLAWETALEISADTEIQAKLSVAPAGF